MTRGTSGSAPSKEDKLRAARLQRLTLVWLGVTLVTISGLIALYYHLLNREIAARLDAIRKDGFPTTYQEINKRHQQVPATENAAVILNEAFPKMTRAAAKKQETPLPFSDRQNIPARLALPSPAERVRIEALLQTNAAALMMLRVATNHARCLFEVRNSQPTQETLIPHVAHVRTAGELLALEAWYAAANREQGKPVDTLRVLFHLATLLEQEPLLPARLIEQRIDRLGCEVLERTLSWKSMRTDELSAIANALKRKDASNALMLTLSSELAVGEHYLNMSARNYTRFLLDLEQNDEGNRALMTLFGNVVMRITGRHQRDHRFFLEIVHELLKAVTLDCPARIQRVSELEERIEAEARNISDPLIYSGMMLPGVVKAMVKDIEHTALMRAAQIAIAIESFRGQDNGNLPAELADLKLSPLPADPFDGRPMRYQRRAKGYMVYSVGPDLEDDSDNKDDAGISSNDDVIFTVER